MNSESESALLHARHFYIGQWYRDSYTEILRQKQGFNSPRKVFKKHTKKKRKKRKGNHPTRENRKLFRSASSGESSDDDSSSSDEVEDDTPQVDDFLKSEVTKLTETRKRFLLTKVGDNPSLLIGSQFHVLYQQVTAFPPASSGARTQTLQTHIDYENAELITRYLASKRPFSQSFDSYLKQVSAF